MFSPVVLQMVGSIIRRLVTLGAGYLIGHGFWTATDAPAYIEFLVTAITTVLLSAGYAAFGKYVKPFLCRLLAK